MVKAIANLLVPNDTIANAREFDNECMKGELFVDNLGNPYMSIHVNVNDRSEGSPSILLMNLKTCTAARANRMMDVQWPLRRLSKNESIELRNDE